MRAILNHRFSSALIVLVIAIAIAPIVMNSPLLLDNARAHFPGVEIATTAAIGELDAVTLAIARAALTLLPA